MSEAKRFSTTNVSTAGRSPSDVTVRSSSRTVRYAGLARARWSDWVVISSRAVARRMTPVRWTRPCSST
ncbi:hypothetical protein ACFQV2_27710 [Actinokineospora soli]|uniref:Uncharacterized protein n=1 Tax=Actinokineospora soli TaxID=1048753 RepID=A0ABW2TUR6_9PSEU